MKKISIKKLNRWGFTGHQWEDDFAKFVKTYGKKRPKENKTDE